MKLYSLFPLLNFVSASTFCDEFLKNDIPQVVKNCGYSDIVSYCCNDKNIEMLKSYSDDFQILCEDTPEQQQAISNITSNIEKLSTECSKQPTLPDDWDNTTQNNNSFKCNYNPLLILLTLFITLF